jgi:hypothetical protein
MDNNYLLGDKEEKEGRKEEREGEREEKKEKGKERRMDCQHFCPI